MDYLEHYLSMDELPRERRTRSPREIVDGAFVSAGLKDLMSYRPSKAAQICASVGAVGVGAASWVSVHVFSYIQHNPEAVMRNIKGAKGGIVFLVENWSECALAYSLVDAVGVDKILGIAFDIGMFSLDNPALFWDAIELADVGLEVAGVGVDLADAAATLGLGLVASLAVSQVAKHYSGDQEKELKELISFDKKGQMLSGSLLSGLPPLKAKESLSELPRSMWAISVGA